MGILRLFWRVALVLTVAAVLGPVVLKLGALVLAVLFL